MCACSYTLQLAAVDPPAAATTPGIRAVEGLNEDCGFFFSLCSHVHLYVYKQRPQKTVM